ncbi:MAG: LacI family DNA-binding transcriptional regulator [Spirochaetia bacterium]
MSKRVTIGDIAKQAGVSSSTVSRVINTPKRVKASTRETVYAAMRRLEYVPATTHRDPESLARIIGFFAPSILLDSVTDTIHAVESELGPTSFDLLLVNMRGERDFASFITRNVHICRKIDGAIVFSADISDTAVEFMTGMDIPLALLHARSPSILSVSNNNFLGGRDAAAYLLGCGYRRLAFVGWRPEDEHISDRAAGFAAALERAGFPLPQNMLAFGPLTTDGGYAATGELFSRAEPDAVFYASDVLALGGMQYLRESGRRVPEDIGVMGFDDLSISHTLGLTTMKQFFTEKAEMIVSYLLSRISGETRENRAEELQMTPRVVARSTTRCITESSPSPGEGDTKQGGLP